MNAVLKTKWLDTPEQWEALAELLEKQEIVGLDSEYYGVERNQSCVGRARIHVWSVAIRTGVLDVRGYTRCSGWVLPGVAALHPRLKAVLESRTPRKAIHNQGVDIHAFANHGVTIRGALNTLGLVRWKCPELVNQPGRFKLKSLMMTLLGREPVCTFKDVVADVRTVTVERTRRVAVPGACECGILGCRKRRGHRKAPRTSAVETYTVDRIEKFEWALPDIVPGHPRWNRLVRYALEDAIAALQVEEVARAAPDPAPFISGERPGFSQATENAFTRMEAVGFHRDREFCAEKAALADELEEKELRWLFEWYVRNAPGFGPWSRTLGGSSRGAKKAGVDAIWSSPAKLLALFDSVNFPRSPIWKKGRVKPGDVKMDETALEWIGRSEPGAAKLVEHVIQLKRIRSGRKYLVKLRDADDLVHIIAGPSSDDDERAGAVTGRAGIKGPLEAQQLPSVEEKDLFQVRRAIVAHDGETLVVADYSSLEVGVQGDWCKRLFDDDQIIEMYRAQARGADIHSNNAREVFGRWLGWRVPAGPYAGMKVNVIPVEEFKQHPFGGVLRSLVKTIWYGLAYGKSAYGFATLVGADGKMIGEELAQEMVDALLGAVPGMRRWFQYVEDFVRKFHGVYSLGGRWCPLGREMETDDKWQHQRAFRRAYNFPCQATGADIIGDAMVRINRCRQLRALGYRICLQVHDELVLRGPAEGVQEAKQLVRLHMESATANGTPLLVPLQVGVSDGFNYWEAK